MFLIMLQSPPPICPWYYWIDTEQPEWALREIAERGRLAWARLHMEEEMKKSVARRNAEIAEEQRYMREKREERKRMWEEEERQRKEARETHRRILSERAAEARAAEERGDKTGKWPRWTKTSRLGPSCDVS